MKKINCIFLVLLVSFFGGCIQRVHKGSTAHTASDSLISKDYIKFTPIVPLSYPKFTVYDTATGKTKQELFPDSAPEVLKHLPLQTTNLQIEKFTATGDVEYITASLTSEAGYYLVIMDFATFRNEPLFNTSEYLGIGKVGVSLRVKATIKTFKANINLGSLILIAVEAKNENLSGDISAEVIGIGGRDVTNIFPLTAQIDQTSISNILQALSSIKAKLWEKGGETRITPHLLGISGGEGTIEQRIKKILNLSVIYPESYQFSESSKNLLDLFYNDKCQPYVKQWIDSVVPEVKSDYARFIKEKKFEEKRLNAIRDLMKKGECNE